MKRRPAKETTTGVPLMSRDVVFSPAETVALLDFPGLSACKGRR